MALSAALAHRAYTSDALGRSRRSLARLRAALQSYMDALATGGEIAASLLRDLEQFLASDRDDIPPSLRQVSRLARSEEVTSVASSTVAALYRGIAGAQHLDNVVDRQRWRRRTAPADPARFAPSPPQARRRRARAAMAAPGRRSRARWTRC